MRGASGMSRRAPRRTATLSALPDYLSYDDDGEAGASDSMPGLGEVSDFAINAME